MLNGIGGGVGIVELRRRAVQSTSFRALVIRAVLIMMQLCVESSCRSARLLAADRDRIPGPAARTSGDRCQCVDGTASRRAFPRRSRSSATPTRFRTSSPSTKTDALFGLGYVHAQDRLWQMEFQRRDRPRPAFGDLRRGDDPAGPLPAHRRLPAAPPGGVGVDARLGEAAAQRLRRRASTRSSPRITAAQLPPEFSLLRFEPGAVDRRRRHRVGEDDGVGPSSATTAFELLRHDLVARRRAGADGGSCCRRYPPNGLSILPNGGTTEDADTKRWARPIKRNQCPRYTAFAPSCPPSLARSRRRSQQGSPAVADSPARLRQPRRSARTTGSWTAR